MSRARRSAARSPRRRYTKGRFVNASLDKASLDNERLAIRLAPEEAPEIAFVLIAGLVARRIVCPVYEGQVLAAGERIGLIRFGSRVDVYIPPPTCRSSCSASAWSAAKPCSPIGWRPGRRAAGVAH